jgi:Domain of unknown function (DUF5666)
MSNFLESKKVRAVLWILGGLIVLCLVFGLGIAVGYGRAGFAAGFDRNYYRNFYGASPSAPMGFTAGTVPVASHGIVGTVIDIGSSTISVEDGKNNEQSIVVSSATVIREENNTIQIGVINVGDQITVIGEPNDQGQIAARFIRIFPTTASSSSPLPQ